MTKDEFAELLASPCPGSRSWAVNHALSIIPKSAPDAEGIAEDATQEAALYFLESPDKLEAAEGPGVVHYVILRRVINELDKQGHRPVGIGADIEEIAVGSLGADLDAQGDELIDAFLAEFQGSTAARQSLLADLLKPENEHAVNRFDRVHATGAFRAAVADRVNRLRSPRQPVEDFIDNGLGTYRDTPEFAVASQRAELQRFEHSLAARPRVLDLDDCGEDEVTA
jgi:hypothetical protein